MTVERRWKDEGSGSVNVCTEDSEGLSEPVKITGLGVRGSRGLSRWTCL
jgi:hypothetical protein